MKFLKFYVVLNDPFLTASFSEQVFNLTHKTYTTMGIDEAVIYITREEAKEEAFLEKDITFTKSLLNANRFSLEEVAELVGVPVAFVQEVKAEMSL
ncbi:hypothetical protein [Dyadobacter alkalitolerans]|uniref:hypothetical protein n=1 Tax=Dyadobacter alkalitolerans TaxID=492736 RepID=UPI00146FBD4D|nr:hypothetical protein [Dyadobacter alkalitolerans]